MIDYPKMYRILFNAITDALRQLEEGNTTNAIQILKSAQQTTEDIYIETTD